MGNVWEWMESPYSDTSYGTGSSRGLRGGDWHLYSDYLQSSYCNGSGSPTVESIGLGFRVASVPEPGSVAMLLGFAVTALLYYWRKHV